MRLCRCDAIVSRTQGRVEPHYVRATMWLSHRDTLSLCHENIVSLLQRHIVSLPARHSVALPHEHTAETHCHWGTLPKRLIVAPVGHNGSQLQGRIAATETHCGLRCDSAAETRIASLPQRCINHCVSVHATEAQCASTAETSPPQRHDYDDVSATETLALLLHKAHCLFWQYTDCDSMGSQP
mgnify:CR=1 FL=1